MITLIFGQLNCGKHDVANELKTRSDEEVMTLADLKKKYAKYLFSEELSRELVVQYVMNDFTADELLLAAACMHFAEEDKTIIIPSSCKKVALGCCCELPHVRCILIAPSAAAIAKLRRKTVPAEGYDPDYFIPSKNYFDEVSIRRNTTCLVKDTLKLAEALGVSERFWCYVAPEYLV